MPSDGFQVVPHYHVEGEKFSLTERFVTYGIRVVSAVKVENIVS